MRLCGTIRENIDLVGRLDSVVKATRKEAEMVSPPHVSMSGAMDFAWRIGHEIDQSGCADHTAIQKLDCSSRSTNLMPQEKTLRIRLSASVLY